MAKSIPEQIIAEVFGGLDARVQTAVGDRERYANLPAPRVVAIPRGAPVIDLPDMPGFDRSVGARRLLLRRFQIDWQCHGEPDFSDAEQLYLAVLCLVRRACHHSVVFSNESWVDQQAGDDGFDRYGSVITFTSVIDIPVFDDPSVLAYLTATPKVVTTATLTNGAL